MNKSMTLRRILLAPPSLRSFILPPLSSFNQPISRQYAVQSITQPSFWAGLIPKPLRKRPSSAAAGRKPRSKEWNPATFFIFIFLFIGSMSIQMIALRNEFATFSRRANAKIGLLKEIIEKIQSGEDVDVEGLLGTGDKHKEKEWEEVLQEIEREEEAWEQSRRTKPKHGRNLANGNLVANSQTTSTAKEEDKSALKTKSNAPPGFY